MKRAAVLLAIGVLAAACGARGAPAHYGPDRSGSVPACTATALRALEQHITLTTLPGPCRGLSRAHLNLALGRAIYEVAALDSTRPPGDAAPPRPRPAWPGSSSRCPGPGSTPSRSRHLRPVRPARWGTGLAALATWLLTMGIGAFMLVPWIRRRGLHPPRAAHRQLGPLVPLGHAGAAGAGLLAWIAYLVTGWNSLGWLAVSILLAVIGLGMATLTVWTAQAPRPPAPGPPGSVPPGSVPPGPVPPGPVPRDATSARSRRTRGDLRIIVPIVHGLAASATILLALLTVVTSR